MQSKLEEELLSDALSGTIAALNEVSALLVEASNEIIRLRRESAIKSKVISKLAFCVGRRRRVVAPTLELGKSGM